MMIFKLFSVMTIHRTKRLTSFESVQNVFYRKSHISETETLVYPNCFWKLLECAPEADFYVFCDQDDAWIKKKLESCNGLCCQYDSRKQLLYVHDYFVCDANLNPYKPRHLLETDFSPDHPYNLVYYVMSPGFTMVLNDELRKRNLWARFLDRGTFQCGFLPEPF